MTPERDLINKALRAFRPTTPEGKLCRDLVLLCERLLGGRSGRPVGGGGGGGDEAALRAEIDDGATTALLVWADRLEESGEDATVCASLRVLARTGKRPGRVGESWRWSAERPEFGGGSSWTLPADAVSTLAARSADLGGKEKGRFPTLSAAMLAAARVLAAGEARAKEEKAEAGRLVRSCPDCAGALFSHADADDVGAVRGYSVRCSLCGKIIRRTLPATLGHLSGDWPAGEELR